MKWIIVLLIALTWYLHTERAKYMYEIRTRQAYQLGLKVGYITRHYNGSKQELESLMNIKLDQATNRLNSLIYDNQRNPIPAN